MRFVIKQHNAAQQQIVQRVIRMYCKQELTLLPSLDASAATRSMEIEEVKQSKKFAASTHKMVRTMILQL